MKIKAQLPRLLVESRIKILQKVRYEYHKLNKVQNIQIFNKSRFNKK